MRLTFRINCKSRDKKISKREKASLAEIEFNTTSLAILPGCPTYVIRYMLLKKKFTLCFIKQVLLKQN